MPAVLRQAIRSDLPDLFRVRRTVSEERPFLLTMPDDQVIESLETTGRGWVIELDGMVVAFAIGDALTGSISALFVDPPHRGKGYGRRLYDTVVEWLWSQDTITFDSTVPERRSGRATANSESCCTVDGVNECEDLTQAKHEM